MSFKSSLKYFSIVVVLLVVAFLVLNLTNRDLHPEAEKLINTQISEAPTLNNTYFSLLGLFSEENDISEAGVNIYKNLGDKGDDFYTIEQDIKFIANKLNQECYKSLDDISSCVNYARENGGIINESALENRKLLDRYRHIINDGGDYIEGKKQRRTFFPADLYGIHDLYLLDIINRSDDLSSYKTEKGVTDNIIFWRKMLANTRSLVNKMISVRSLNHAYKVVAERLYQCPDCHWGDGDKIFSPLNSAELSVNQVFESEFLWMANNLPHEDEEKAKINEVLDIFYRYNRVINRLYGMHETYIDASSYGHLDNPRYIKKMMSKYDSDQLTWWLSLYNDPASKIMTAIAVPEYGKYKQVILYLDLKIRSLNAVHQYFIENHTKKEKKTYLIDVMTAVSKLIDVVDKYNIDEAKKTDVTTQLNKLATLIADPRIAEEANYWAN